MTSAVAEILQVLSGPSETLLSGWKPPAAAFCFDDFHFEKLAPALILHLECAALRWQKFSSVLWRRWPFYRADVFFFSSHAAPIKLSTTQRRNSALDKRRRAAFREVLKEVQYDLSDSLRHFKDLTHLSLTRCFCRSCSYSITFSRVQPKTGTPQEEGMLSLFVTHESHSLFRAWLDLTSAEFQSLPAPLVSMETLSCFAAKWKQRAALISATVNPNSSWDIDASDSHAVFKAQKHKDGLKKKLLMHRRSTPCLVVITAGGIDEGK